MHLLYLDESGQHGGKYFALAGMAVFERQTYWITDAINRIENCFFPNIEESLYLHASEIRAAAIEPWKTLGKAKCLSFLDQVYDEIAKSKSVLFGIAIERGFVEEGTEYLVALESVVKSFDNFLVGLHKQTEERQRGLVIVAESQWRQRLEEFALKFDHEGTKWGDLYNLAEIPLFTRAKNSRLLQAADFVANAVWG